MPRRPDDEPSDGAVDVAIVRSFNRTVTERVGALQDRYLSRDRSLGEARLLWEIGEDGCELRVLRARLGLDSGYLSRLLRSLEAAALVTVTANAGDRRVRIARLTAKGRRERQALDGRSDELAAGILASLRPAQRRRLLDAMAEVERLLAIGMVEIRVTDPDDPAAQHCLGAYFAELDRRFHSGFDPSAALPALAEEMRPPHGLFLVAFRRDEPVGSGALKFHGRSPAEVKRMWVSPSMRGTGLGRRLLDELEQRAVEHGVTRLRLETNAALREAIAMYRSNGYREIAPFNTEPYADHWFEKRLPKVRVRRGEGRARS